MIQTTQKATENSDIIGLGVNHIFSKTHLDLKQQMMEKIYNVQLNDNNNNSHPSTKYLAALSYFFRNGNNFMYIFSIHFKFMYSNRLTSLQVDHHAHGYLFIIYDFIYF